MNTSGMTHFRTTVLVSTSRHPVSGFACPNRNDVVALELGRQLARGTLRVIHAGDPTDPALQDYLAYGAHTVDVLPATPGTDVSRLLPDPLRDSQLVLCGGHSSSGTATGMLPYLLAAALEWPVITDILSVELGTRMARVTQFLPKGKRRRLEIPLPAVITVHPLAPVVPRYAYARRVAGRVQTVSAPNQPGQAPDGQIDATARSPVRLKAPDHRSGHARMLSATAAARGGGQVVIEGSSVEKAQVVLAYLREHGLISF
jgi:electron transfer flavoprotein beta subunit